MRSCSSWNLPDWCGALSSSCMVFSPLQDAEEEEGEVITTSVGEGEGCSVPLHLCWLRRRWEAAWEALAPHWDRRCHLPWHRYRCQTGVREGPFFWVGLYFRVKFHSSRRRGGRKSYFPVKGLPACIPRMACGGNGNGAGRNPINHIPGGKALAFCFSPLPLISPTLWQIPGAAQRRNARRRKHSNHIDATPFLQQAIYIFLFSSHLNSGEFGNSDSLGSVHSAFVRVDVFWSLQLGSHSTSLKNPPSCCF